MSLSNALKADDSSTPIQQKNPHFTALHKISKKHSYSFRSVKSKSGIHQLVKCKIIFPPNTELHSFQNFSEVIL